MWQLSVKMSFSGKCMCISQEMWHNCPGWGNMNQWPFALRTKGKFFNVKRKDVYRWVTASFPGSLLVISCPATSPFFKQRFQTSGHFFFLKDFFFFFLIYKARQDDDWTKPRKAVLSFLCSESLGHILLRATEKVAKVN